MIYTPRLTFQIAQIAIIVAMTLTLWRTVNVVAQTNCPYATLVFETTMLVDAEAICQAAKPWADEGNRVLVLLTDFQPASEEAWFEYLNQAEAQAGFRDASQSDHFARNGVALEFSTSNAAWAQSITVGDSFFESDLGSEAEVNVLKTQIGNAIAAGNPTEGFVTGLEGAYNLAYPGTSPLVWGVLGAAGAGVLAGGGLIAARAMRPRRERQRQREALQAHLDLLRTRTNNLLGASDRLLAGDRPGSLIQFLRSCRCASRK